MAKDKEKSSRKGGMLVGLLGGVLTGAAAAMLLAPKTGKHTRGILKEKITQGVEKIKNMRESKDRESV